MTGLLMIKGHAKSKSQAKIKKRPRSHVLITYLLYFNMPLEMAI